jgi:glycolate oxidase FAD binding subunit
VLAAGRSGPGRLRFGPVRNHVLGMRVLLADGTVARSGGQLVKNVTGYDLHRLYCGSHGSLCIVLEAALRLFPEPEHELLVTVHTPADRHTLALAEAARALPTRMVSLLAQRAGGWELTARLFGKRAAVERERELLLDAWPGATVVEGEDARRAAEQSRDGLPEAGARPWLRLGCVPSRATAALAAVESFGPTRLVLQPGIATLDAVFADDLDSLVAATRALRAELAPETAVSLRDAPPEVLAEVAPFADAGPGLGLMRELKRRFDPGGVLARGRFHPGL